jgi:hypothetical protein
MSDLAIEYESVEALIPYAANSRTHSDAQVAQIAASIKEFGWTNPILIDGDNTIIAGHGRLLAARKLGMDEVPAIRIGHLSKAQQRALVIADNQLAMNAGWDMDMLKAEIEGLKLDDFDVDLLGFSDLEIADIFKQGEEDAATLDSDKYTTKITVPIYEITGVCPTLDQIYETSKSDNLIDEIEGSENIPSDIKQFLKAAAYRHIRFNYENIAEFYAHANDTVRKLMRDSALVIIDYDEAIEGGYIKLTKELMELAGENEEL